MLLFAYFNNFSIADFKIAGNLGLVGLANTGIFYNNVINHVISE